MFTQRAALLGFVAFCFYLIAVVNVLPGFYYALTWLSMAMLAASLGVAWLSLIGLECEIKLNRSRGAAPLAKATGADSSDGNGALIGLSISNAGTLNKTNVVLEVRVRDAKNEVQALRFLIEAIASGAAIESVLPLCGLQRGRYQLQEARLFGSDVLGLFRMQKKLAFDAQSAREIIIGPAVLQNETHLQGGSNGFLAGNQRALVARHGEELRGTRPYAPGDDLRHVHWKSSARAGELVVKEWEQTGQSSALIIWDGAAQTTWGSGEFDSGEWSLILAASLAHALLAGGTPCDFARLDAKPLLVETRALVGGELPPELTEALADALASRTIALETALLGLPRLMSRTGSKVIVVSASLSGDLVRGVLVLRARGAQVQIFLIDAASLAARSNDRRFRARNAKLSISKMPTQSDNDKNQTIFHSNFENQVAKLREAGAIVVPVSAEDARSADNTLRAALRDATATSKLRQIAQ